MLRTSLRNSGTSPVRVREIVLTTAPHTLPPDTAYYAEGFQMLSQTAGTVGAPEEVGAYTDRGHYKMPEAPDCLTAYGLATCSPPTGDHVALAFTSCRRFVGVVRITATHVELALDAEGLSLAAGEEWALEDCWIGAAPDRDALLDRLAALIAGSHPRLPAVDAPTGRAGPSGWCSWYWYGPSVSEDDVIANLRAIASHKADLRFIQIDDGFQAAMGDWLEPGERFPGGVGPLCRRIQQEGFEPAIWLAPFIAERESRLVREHPEWLVKDAHGQPLLSSEISFGGWRRGPWFMLDGTHPGALGYLEHVCRTIRREWGCRYFKLDALTWGVLHGGHRHDPTATRVDAYRFGMAAILRGAGDDSFILGCNAPMWPSLGTVHGMRASNDVTRTWRRVTQVARECFWRSWQHGRLWVNDPDCVVLINRPGREIVGPGGERPRPASELTADEFDFHAAAVLATGGMVLSGDDLTRVPRDGWNVLERVASGPGVAARFEDTTWQVGRIDTADGQIVFALNWSDAARAVEITIPSGVAADYWTGAPLATAEGAWRDTLPPHGARVLSLRR